jgi:hypothetical protein
MARRTLQSAWPVSASISQGHHHHGVAMTSCPLLNATAAATPFRGIRSMSCHHGGRRGKGGRKAAREFRLSTYPDRRRRPLRPIPSHQPPTAISVPAFEALYSTLLLGLLLAPPANKDKEWSGCVLIAVKNGEGCVLLPVMARGIWTVISAKSVGLPASASVAMPIFNSGGR